MNRDYVNPSFPQPENENVSLWRYMDIEKFRWLIKEQRLFFPHVSILREENEGNMPERQRKYFKDKIKDSKTPEEKSFNKQAFETVENFTLGFKQGYFVSCWHMNDEMSPSKWNEFEDHPDNGDRTEVMAIRTTYKRLRDSLPVHVWLGMVKYETEQDSYQEPSLNRYVPIMTKNERKCGWENEVRAVADLRDIIDRDNIFVTTLNNVPVYAPPINLKKLIVDIHAHPKATEKHLSRMQKLLRLENLCDLSIKIT